AVDLSRAAVDGAVEVTGELVTDSGVVGSIAHRADRGRMLVVEHRRLGRVYRLVVGSTVNGICARTSVPVVSVPTGWEPTSRAVPVITVAVQHPHEASGLLRVALAQAEAIGARVEVLHTWWLSNGFDNTAVDQPFRDEAARTAQAEFEPVLQTLAVEFPSVSTHVTVRHAPPVEALLDAAETSDLLVVGRRHHMLPAGSHLGPVARTVLDQSAAPVLVAPGADRPASGMHGERLPARATR
ncbi:MAG: universal stress protein, partial [Nocardioides sp.]